MSLLSITCALILIFLKNETTLKVEQANFKIIKIPAFQHMLAINYYTKDME